MSNRPSESSILNKPDLSSAAEPPVIAPNEFVLRQSALRGLDLLDAEVIDAEVIGVPSPMAVVGSDTAHPVTATVFESGAGTITTSERAMPRRKAWLLWPFWLIGRVWDAACMSLLVAIIAAIPILQLASLGYLLFGAGRLAAGQPWSVAFPGLRLAGKLGTFAAFVAITWLPVYILADLAYTAHLLQPGSQAARAWRLGSFLIAVVWTVHVGWAAMRGGRWWHLLWPAPIKFMKSIWRPSIWSLAADQLYDLWCQLKFLELWWLGARASAGAVLWTCVPVSLMIIGLRAQDFKPAALVGLIGALAMTVVMLYLPLLQVRMASTNRFREVFNVRAIRREFKKAPWFLASSIFFVCAMAIPLYLLRIEATPSELAWLPSLVFVLFMWPAKLLLGAALGYANRRQVNRHWTLRWSAWTVALASVLIYVGALYIAQFAAWQGAFVMYFQHAVLVPPPLVSN